MYHSPMIRRYFTLLSALFASAERCDVRAVGAELQPWRHALTVQCSDISRTLDFFVARQSLFRHDGFQQGNRRSYGSHGRCPIARSTFRYGLRLQLAGFRLAALACPKRPARRCNPVLVFIDWCRGASNLQSGTVGAEAPATRWSLLFLRLRPPPPAGALPECGTVPTAAKVEG